MVTISEVPAEAAKAAPPPAAADSTTPPPKVVEKEVSSSSSSSNSNMNPLLLTSYVTIVGIWGMSQVVLIPYVIHLMVLVCAILYAACHASLVLREEPHEEDDLNDSEHSSTSERETLRKEDAYQFPLVGSVSLFSLYLAFKFLDKDLVNMLIGAYFGLVGCIALTMTLAPAIQFTGVIPKSLKRKRIGWQYQLNHSMPEWVAGPSPLDLSQEFTISEIAALIVSIGIVAMYMQNKTWYLNNILGISFCLQGISKFSLGTYQIASILLVGLFFYDIFWVFGTEVMVTVAKNLDGPIKILFPRTLVKDPETGRIETSLLGLGDIVIPGFFLALLLRFDAHIANQPTRIGRTDFHAPFPKPYFHTTLIAYMVGLATTLFVMIYFEAAQPALLYLVPACLGSSLAVAYYRNEVKELFEYSEEQPELEEEEEDGEGEEGNQDGNEKEDGDKTPKDETKKDK